MRRTVVIRRSRWLVARGFYTSAGRPTSPLSLPSWLAGEGIGAWRSGRRPIGIIDLRRNLGLGLGRRGWSGGRRRCCRGHFVGRPLCRSRTACRFGGGWLAGFGGGWLAGFGGGRLAGFGWRLARLRFLGRLLAWWRPRRGGAILALGRGLAIP